MQHKRIPFAALIALTFSIVAARAVGLEPGQASGTYTLDGTNTAITHAVAFVDQGDERKPLVLILSDEAISTEGWKSGLDFMRYRMKNPFLGVAFWLDQDRKLVRTAWFDAEGLPQGKELGLFELELDADGGEGTLKGSAHSTEAAATQKKPVLLDAGFNANVPQ